MRASIEIKLEDVESYKIDYSDSIERAYDTIISALIYDEDGHVIASDDYVERLTSESIEIDNKERIISEESTDFIIKKYISRINRMFETIEKYNGDWHAFWMSMQPTEDFYMDREDIEYNEDLWYQYKPLYDLLTRKGYEKKLAA